VTERLVEYWLPVLVPLWRERGCICTEWEVSFTGEGSVSMTVGHDDDCPIIADHP